MDLIGLPKLTYAEFFGPFIKLNIFYRDCGLVEGY